MLKAEVMVHQHPPTPPSGPAELQYGLHHLVQHNASTQYKYENDEQAYLQPGSGSGYGTPAAVMERQHSGDPYTTAGYGVSAYPEPHAQNDIGLGISMVGNPEQQNAMSPKVPTMKAYLSAPQDGYGAPGPTYYHDDSQQQHGHSYVHNGIPQNRSPPTPRSTTASDVGPRSRNGNSVARTASPHAKHRVTKPKAKKAGKADKPKTPKLTAPLSELTKGFENIPVKNMEEWVNRPASVRKSEVEKRNGYVTRPMNSFMLYRSAYAERTKQWCLQNNHQVVSSVSGESWPLEPPEVREQYNEYAKIERINHQNAHPDYKFSPSKASGAAARKRKGIYSDEEPEEEPSDLDDDGEWAPSRRAKIRSARRSGREVSYADHSYVPHHGLNRSTWEATNEGRPLPVSMGANDLHHQYYQTTVHPNMAGPGIEDIRMQRVENAPVRHYPSPMGQSLLGLPGGQHHELLQMPYHEGQPISQEPQVDPMLLAYDGGVGYAQGGQNGEAHYDPGYPEEYNGGYVGDETGPQHQGPEWQVDQSLMAMENGLEFDKWMD